MFCSINPQAKALDTLSELEQTDAASDPAYRVVPGGDVLAVDSDMPNAPISVTPTRTRRQTLAPFDSVDANNLPIHHSKPGSPHYIFLNFQGEVVSGTSWNGIVGFDPIVTSPFYDNTNSLGPMTLSDAQRDAVTDIWMRVAEGAVHVLKTR